MNEEIKEILKSMKKANNEDCNLWLVNESVKLLYNYITNLQEENERLKDDLQKADNKNLELIEELNKEIDRYEDTISFDLGYEKGGKDYKSRCDKAIEYIKEEGTTYLNLANQRKWCSEFSAENILKILGGDEE